MSKPATTSQRANEIGRAIRRAFNRSQQQFREITQRAGRRFAERDWHGIQSDGAERLDVYEATVEKLVELIHQLLGDRIESRLMWVSIKAVYSGLISDRDDWEIAETFFNSITRRIFDTVGVDEEIEFVHTDYQSPPTAPKQSAFRSFDVTESLADAIQHVLRAYDLPWDDDGIGPQAAECADDIQQRLQWMDQSAEIQQIDMLEPACFRGEFAYLVGRIPRGDRMLPLVFCLKHTAAKGVYVDAVLLEESDVSLLFSYARSSFHIDTNRPFGIVRFVKSIIPGKPTAEIYISIGYNKHGKTELYRHALRHLAGSTDCYQLAPGARGMVMVVFTMPSYPVVFKIIKDRFDYPKDTTRQAVMDCYRLVFKHDRAGRLIDAQQYQYLTLDRHRFDDRLLEELLEVASQTVRVEGDSVVIKHCYAERRVTPLNVYLQDADEQAARDIVIDYGQSIKDLALTNIFPGDLLLKNFGVTRQRRLVYYDYDEVCLLTDCKFRKLPDTDDYDEQMAAEPWFAVGKYDVFPEEFRYFLGLPPPLREAFMEHHADLLTVDYWLGVQQQIRDGELFHFAPYSDDRRLAALHCASPPFGSQSHIATTAQSPPIIASAEEIEK